MTAYFHYTNQNKLEKFANHAIQKRKDLEYILSTEYQIKMMLDKARRIK